MRKVLIGLSATAMAAAIGFAAGLSLRTKGRNGAALGPPSGLVELEHGAWVEPASPMGAESLEYAVQEEKEKIVGALVDGGANVNYQSPATGDTPLHVAASAGRISLAEMLLAKGADMNLRNHSGQTAVHAAAQGGAECMALLLDHGADSSARDAKGETPLYIAAWIGDTGTVRLLLECGARSDIKDEQGRTALDVARERGHTAVVGLLEGKSGRPG